MTASAFAPAKINLALHVVGQRGDGYHLLDSLVAFAAPGDRVTAAPDGPLTLSVTGRFAADVPAGPDNLVLRAARLVGADAVHLTLEKNLPVASGIGGGSADAAATIRALMGLLHLPEPSPEALLSLGADVPVCMKTGLVRMRGIGDELEEIDPGPIGLSALLVNPGVPVSTPAVFAGLARKDNPPMQTPPAPQDAGFVDWLARQRNDLEAPAIAIAPEIGGVLDRIRALPGCALARMSGSGATCFALFDNPGAADAAKLRIGAERTDWWVCRADL